MKKYILLSLLVIFILIPTTAKKTTTHWEQKAIQIESLSNWQLLGNGSVSVSMNGQVLLTESDDSQGVMLISPDYYSNDVIVRYKILALTNATVFVNTLSLTNIDSAKLTIPLEYDGGISLLTSKTANYFIAFKNAPHGTTPFIAKNPGFEIKTSSPEQDRMTAGVYYDIEVGRKGSKIWLAVDGKQIISWKDDNPIRGGHIAFRLRGTAGLNAAALIKDLEIYTRS